MIVVGFMLAGLLLVLVCGNACDDKPRDDSRMVDALLFLLVLVGVVAASQRKRTDDESCG